MLERVFAYAERFGIGRRQLRTVERSYEVTHVCFARRKTRRDICFDADKQGVTRFRPDPPVYVDSDESWMFRIK